MLVEVVGDEVGHVQRRGAPLVAVGVVGLEGKFAAAVLAVNT